MRHNFKYLRTFGTEYKICLRGLNAWRISITNKGVVTSGFDDWFLRIGIGHSQFYLGHFK